MTGRVCVLALLAACSGKLPETRYYQLAAPEPHATPGAELLVLETPTTDQAYDDDRIVYRTTPFRFDYYQYQRWSSPPGVMIGNYLEQALEASGKFRGVVRELVPDAPVVLSGRVIAIEEVDRSKTEWLGRLRLELVLTDARSNEALWTQHFDETEPLRQQTPEGLAAALSTVMARIAHAAVPEIAAITERQARAHDDKRDPKTAAR
ncbi:MAG TPA: ABC-type transport auxiliary lipoprotein family protein [Kofleriaceae bacterium]|nr:ABC-type transport auxiliary lipoprotein family protein [Kofleriaceae bacterium]